MRTLSFSMLCLAFAVTAQPIRAADSAGNAVAGTYDLLICQGTCSFAEQKNVLVKGQLVLFADKLAKADLDRFDENRFQWRGGDSINGCFTLEAVRQHVIYAGIEKIGVTTWSEQGNKYQFELFRSPDAGYGASVERTTTGLLGSGSSWGAGAGAPQQHSEEFIVARRTGDAKISNCIFQTAEEAELKRLRADPAREKMFALENVYRKSLFASLQASRSPRDWAMAGWLKDSEEGWAQILRARKAAPDDGLIQWIAVHRTRPSSHAVAPGMYELRSTELDSAALLQLQKAEADNAVPWLISLRAAVYANNAAAIDKALEHLVVSSRCDDHAAELFQAQIELFRSHPLPDEYFAEAKRLDPGWQVQPPFTQDVAPYYGNHYPFAAIGMNNLFFMAGDDAGLHELFVVCSRGDRSAARIETCAKIGRLLAGKATRWRTRQAGSMLLNEIPSFTAEDIERARADAWIAERYSGVGDSVRKEKPRIGEEIAFAKDWIQSGSEFESMRRALARSGQSPQPPVDWSLNKALYKNFEEARAKANVDPKH